MNTYSIEAVFALLTPFIVVLWANLEKRNFALWGGACTLAMTLVGILVSLHNLISAGPSLGKSLIEMTSEEWILSTVYVLGISLGVIVINGMFFAGLVALILLGVSITARLDLPHKIFSIAVFAAVIVGIIRHMWITVPLISDEDIVANFKQNRKLFVQLVELDRADPLHTKEKGMLMKRLAVKQVSTISHYTNVYASEESAAIANALNQSAALEARKPFLVFKIMFLDSSYKRPFSIRYFSTVKSLIAFPSPPNIRNGAVWNTDAHGQPVEFVRVIDSLDRYPNLGDPWSAFGENCALRKIDPTWFIELCFGS